MNKIKEHLDRCLKEMRIDSELQGEILNKTTGTWQSKRPEKDITKK